MSNSGKREILLESGTNEMEIIEFYVGSQSMGINVQKLKEIISYDPSALTVVPDTPAAMLGVLMMRGNTLPLIDLKTLLGQRHQDESAGVVQPVVLICEFNHRINGFKVDGVNQIHRVDWADLQPLAPFIEQYRPRFTGTVHVAGREILILDLEYIIGEFDPDSVLTSDSIVALSDERLTKIEKRRDKKILMAEDSAVIRGGVRSILGELGYAGLEVFVDGAACYRRVLALKKQAEEADDDIRNHLHLVISDIEMPKMDGLTLCRKIKQELGYTDLPVLLFSSLINPPMEVKCDSVGADGYASKPDIATLVEMMDRFLEI